MTQTVLTCSPYFVDLALNEIRRYHPAVTLLEHLSPGYLLLEVPISFEQLTLPWRSRLPIYLHHLFPIQQIIPLESPYDLQPLKWAVRKIASQDAVVQIRITPELDNLYPLADVQRQFSGRRKSALLPPEGPIISVLLAQIGSKVNAYLGYSHADHNLSPWAGGQIPITEPVCNRAGYKLIEALHAFRIRLHHSDHALDLGAAPGAWTTLLRQHGMRVTAVAPTPLYPWLMLDPGVTYYPMLAEEYLEKCHTEFGLIVNDMRLDAQDSSRVMVSYANHMRPDGIAIMTLKLRSRNTPRVMDHAFRILRRAYKIIRVRQLVSNRKEITLFLRSKA